MSEKTRKSLPFEPTGNEKPGAKPKRPPIVMNKPDPNPAKLADSRIPDVVSRRMIQRGGFASEYGLFGDGRRRIDLWHPLRILG
jgi:hypothetical protein